MTIFYLHVEFLNCIILNSNKAAKPDDPAPSSSISYSINSSIF